MSFAKLNLSEAILAALTKHGYVQPTPIQMQAIPRVLAGKDLIATAQTGTGKTAAFMLPALEKLAHKSTNSAKPRILVLTPTRELATQVNDAAKKYGSALRINVVNILGGMPYHAQIRQLSRPVDIIVATPGRLIDYLDRGKIDLSQIEMLILDEADRMLDMGFIDAVRHIAKATPANRQTLLFTATMDTRLAKLAQTILREPERIEVAKTMTLDNIEQRIYLADDEKHKNSLLQHLIEAEAIDKAIIFSATKRNADKLARQLYDMGHAAAALHGDMNQHKRNKTITQLRHGRIQLLVATDVAARGIDISEITHVFNYDLPKFAEDYVHRIGRTGRAGKSGIAISLVSFDTINDLKRIERFTGHTIKQTTVEGLEPTRKISKPNFAKPKKSWHDRSSFKPRSNNGNSNEKRPRQFSGQPKKFNNGNSNRYVQR